MSNFAITWAFETQLENPTHKLVLADFADSAGESFPSVEMLAWRACTSPRTVRRALQALEEEGLLERVMGLTNAPGGGQIRTNSVFRLKLPERVAQAPAQVRRPSAVRETPSQAREVTRDLTVIAGAAHKALVIERPSQAREVTGDLTADREVTGDHTVRTPVTIPPTPPYKEEPPVGNPPNPPAPHAADGAGSGSGQVGQDEETSFDEAFGRAADAAAPPPEHGPAWSWDGTQDTEPAVDADWALMRDCLPEPMQALDGPTVTRVAALLRERIDAGWTPDLLHATLAGNELPKHVHRLGGLVVTRLREIPVEGAPRRRPVPTPKPAPPAEGPRFWRAHQVAKKRAELLGLPDAQRPSFWWMQQPGGVALTAIPLTTDLEAGVRELIAAETDVNPSTSTLEIVR